MGLHMNARCEVYPRAPDVKRFPVPDDKVDWAVKFPEYKPTDFTSKSVSSQPVWADNPDPCEIKFNCVDESLKVDRRCFKNGQPHSYAIDEKGYPINPSGRTGLKGRGSLGRWGPNHAADPIVTRWKRDSKGNVVQKDGKNVLQFVAVKRTDGGGWALPGGMVNPGENKTATLIREFGEEALNSLEKSEKQIEEMKKSMADFFKDGETVYKGYVDDPRNTDNSWMETKAMNFHDSNGECVGKFSLHAGDDAAEVQWMDIDHSLKLYASHIDFIKATVGRLNAHW
ncbi:hypothetical protein DPMN_008342 [Dreissena polymorpha]|uniref:Nudix hydrolase domain-containing protein n=2 Tax=Dreissena polymorpha TaxID=45954 RepID=A0A9D4MZ36_DREPO|nr:hypothetical protein DPMN_008342 [Dreissena polymorpha]